MTTENRKRFWSDLEGTWSTTGHDSWMTFEQCAKAGVHLLLWRGGGGPKENFGHVRVCIYPGRGITRLEEKHIIARWRALPEPRALNYEETKAALEAAADEVRAEKLAEVLTT